MTGVVGIIAIAVVLLVLPHHQRPPGAHQRPVVRCRRSRRGGGRLRPGLAHRLPGVPRRLRRAPDRGDRGRGPLGPHDAPPGGTIVLLAWLVLIGVVAQALVGGITALTGLNPFIVGFTTRRRSCSSASPPRSSCGWRLRKTARTGRPHLVRDRDAHHRPRPGRDHPVRRADDRIGPHSGDADVLRRGFDATVLAHVHSWPGYILAALVLS
ncbi:hypothetical protein AB1285_19535 [Microbacterium sp. NRRL B-14842]|uniref:hypothetical protein n=1 Tax=Microbacterium sp. NRRL B-14842 TaxID=3162881 RepID=UPI003D2699AC